MFVGFCWGLLVGWFSLFCFCLDFWYFSFPPPPVLTFKRILSHFVSSFLRKNVGRIESMGYMLTEAGFILGVGFVFSENIVTASFVVCTGACSRQSFAYR